MLVLVGFQIHSNVARTKLVRTLRDAGIPLDALHDRVLYFLDVSSPLNRDQRGGIESLLNSGGELPTDSGERLYVLPREGTHSSWSSKANDILQIAGFSAVNRIERGRFYLLAGVSLTPEQRQAATDILHDKMTEQICWGEYSADRLFSDAEPRTLTNIQFDDDAGRRLSEISQQLGLGLSPVEIAYLADYCQREGRGLTDAELVMFAQINSEHCRHKIFNAVWTVDGQACSESLFEMIKQTYRCAPKGVLTAYHDNSAVIDGAYGQRWQSHPETGEYEYVEESLPMLMKVETHNHPTAISPFPGAATGVGGEIRDEAATGRGGRSKAGLCGFTVSDLSIPGMVQPWEKPSAVPRRIASPLQIMLEAPIGAAAFSNEFGRPCLCGYFRTFERITAEGHYGYHKPLMIAGGFGNIRRQHLQKNKFGEGALIVVLGGPAMLIGLGGGAASSQSGGGNDDLDFASVQRDNAEMQRRCQGVIDRCASLDEANPIISIHDVGAGGLSNAVPELLHDAGVGGHIELRDIPSADSGMSPMEIWCNEAQERYVLALLQTDIERFSKICRRERCPFAVIGQAVSEQTLVLNDQLLGTTPISLPMSVLFGNPPKMTKTITLNESSQAEFDAAGIDFSEAVKRVLSLPAVAAKNFLITIGDRTVGGMTVQDQLVGPWQMPVADSAVCTAAYTGYAGEAMAMGERTPLSLVNAEASARMAVSEAITNILACDIRDLSDIRLSANWMAACGSEREDEALFRAVRAVGMELCPALGIAVPVGKDSLSMYMKWSEDGQDRLVSSPLSLIVSAFAPVRDVRRCNTPQLQLNEDTRLLLVDLSSGENRLGGTSLAQVFSRGEGPCADLNDPEKLKSFSLFIRGLRGKDKILAYHDRSDGGLFVTLAEMAFASRCGLHIRTDTLNGGALEALFSEEPGVVIQVRAADLKTIQECAERHRLNDSLHIVGSPAKNFNLHIEHREFQHDLDLAELKRIWWQTSYRMQALRDDPDCAKEELEQVADCTSRGLYASLSFNPDTFKTHTLNVRTKPKAAILREQGVNGHLEMAAAFERAGFAPVDVSMTDLLSGNRTLKDFQVLAACGGFSYGDALGAGRGWAGSILFNGRLRDEFEHFFQRDDSLTLGVCNGCQMLSQLRTLIPGASEWPAFARNRSDQFEARFSLVEVLPSESKWLMDMAGSQLPIAVAHGEGKVVFDDPDDAGQNLCLRYIDSSGQPTEIYPHNPNGSAGGMTGFCNADGRVLIMMPHPERMFRSVHYPCSNENWGEEGPWLKLFQNAGKFLI